MFPLQLGEGTVGMEVRELGAVGGGWERQTHPTVVRKDGRRVGMVDVG